MTENVFDGTQALGLEYIPGTEHVFGNNGSVGVDGNASSGSNTALDDLEPNPPISAATLLADLTTASDHLPVVADYTFAPAASVPEPDSRALVGMGGLALLVFWVLLFFHSELARCYASPNRRGIETDFFRRDASRGTDECMGCEGSDYAFSAHIFTPRDCS